jgi:hypothetical protein
MSMTRWVRSFGAGVLALLLCGAVSAQTPGEKSSAAATPEQVVTRYLDALKAGNFAAAYDEMSKAMAQGKSRDAWAKEQQWTMQMSDAKIFEFHIYPGKIEGDKAQVPDILNSQDKFLNQLGVPEYELYTLVREDGRWKIDQQVLLEKADQAKWFPAQAPQK